ncbi:disulfide bond formation protein DsbB [Vibrio sp. TH_r3]|uniref:disulfide bond formation protein DsbB n=1 Tax=Vibrio sp. TH_r3 TaxID=3082084 RepID=UPI002953C31E|nr:disulfide bond formation protein DsbB [Vibrio sp. TH_r3]MDV7103982.1 disulfide bond formation protein DsbB [Vibrio sp. TH_r3]
MNFFSALNTFSKTRLSWLLLFFFIVFFIACAYTFQHLMALDPCVMCIYERIAMIGIGISALFAAINPQIILFRWLGILAWGATSLKGLLLALEHVSYQNNIFATCSPLLFPDWAPLNKWLPSFFEATGSCSEVVWQFVTLSMPQWLVVIFATSFAISCIIALSQCFNTKR